MDHGGSQKRCSRCGEIRDSSNFSFKNRAKGLLHSFCRACHKAWNRAHYEKNRATYIATAQRNNAIYIAENLRRLLEFLLDNPCVDCGETDPLVLDFDHRDPSTKRMEVSSLVRHAGSWSALEEEIAKCDVRCANDHRRRTARQFGWKKIALEALVRQGRQGSNLRPSVLETDALPVELRP